MDGMEPSFVTRRAIDRRVPERLGTIHRVDLFFG